ncbi:rho guanine nucleotide exchange factor 19 [Monodelphis domestica]|uniref:rho guanine nucleotide exchange factor 19 n=1 Tax=Monodelphis domestica TaxID=13616 RepID=UPI0024E201C0|nr:rho guanine nucleotide exchange factor 19 [Monodelphis domestica]XP_007491716.2 rho guanine nucleotide exchange factor 19 [Monodelphis domestica]
MDYRPSPNFQPHLAAFCYGGSQTGPLGAIPGGPTKGREELSPTARHPVAVCQQESLSFAELPSPFELGPWPLEVPATSHGLLWPLPVGAQDTRLPTRKPSAFGDDALSEFLGGPRSPQHPEPQRRTSLSSEKEKSAWRKMRVYQREEADAVFPEVGAGDPQPHPALELPRTLGMAVPSQVGTKEPERRRFSASELMNRLQSAQRKATFSLRLGKGLTKDRGGVWAAREGRTPEKEQSCLETRVDDLVPPAPSGPGERDGCWPGTRPDPVEEAAPKAWIPHERRQSRFLLNSILYQEYSDVASDRELQRQKHEEDALVEEAEGEEEGPGPPRANLSPSSSFRAQRSARGSTFSLWQDIPDVRSSGLLAIIGLQECKLQEARFELITSEASYIHSLSVAVGHFMGSTELAECLGAQEKQWLFSKLPEVKATSERFLLELEQRLEEDILRFCVCDIVLRHCPAFRRVYLPYVTNQAYQERTYQRLLLKNPKFPSILSRLEEAPICQRLPLTSFLILPFQRITRLKMLVENILKRTGQGSRGEDMATKAFNELKKLVQECNASVQSMKRTEELIHLNKKIHFESKIFPLISQSRWLVRHGELVELAPSTMPAASATKPKLSSKAIYLHAFNDCLLFSRRKEMGKFAVFLYARMPEIQVKDLSLKPQGIPGQVFLLQFLQKCQPKNQLLLRAQTESEKRRWISAMCPSSSQEDKDAINENEDIPQVQCIKAYKALEPDELTLEKADILAVKTRTSDGWLEGIRLADGERGWVPQAYVDEITSRSARLRNIRETRRIESATNKLQGIAA